MERFVPTMFLAAATYNIAGMLLFSRLFTNTALHAADPVMFSVPGCVLVMVWGLAFAAQSRYWRMAPAISAVFAVEKTVYVVWWLLWLSRSGERLGELFADDWMAGSFYAVYGAGDAAFGAFFVYAALRTRATVANPTAAR